MRMVFVHGINQEGRSEESLKREWLGFLGLDNGSATEALQVSLPFYGDCLAGLTPEPAHDVITQGPSEISAKEETNFLAAALTEQAEAMGIGAKEISLEERAQRQQGETMVTEQGFPMDRRVNAVLRVLEKVSPFHGDFVMGVLKQAYDYLKRPGVASLVDAIVRPVLDAEPAIVVSHSLGTVVTFKILRQLALEKRPIKVPLYVTLGSPLPLKAVQAALGPAFIVPAGVERWVNAVDPDDLIALGRGLDTRSFAAGIENILDIRNVRGDPHAIEGYLRDQRVADAIIAASRA